MTKLELMLREEHSEIGEPKVFIGWKIVDGENKNMNELAHLVKDLVYKSMKEAMQLLHEEKIKKEFKQKITEEMKHDMH